VTWTNRDDMPHTVTSPGTPRALDSAALDTDDQFSFAFERPGTFDYVCILHPKMAGRVIVK
jgi:plastocyanin